MTNFKKNILFIFIGMFMLLLMLSGKVYGAEATLSSSTKNIATGSSLKINVGVQATEAWNLKLSASGGTLGGNTTSTDAPGTETTKTVMTANFSASTPGTYTITLTGQITGSDLVKKDINKTMTITVATPQPPKFQDVNQTVYAKSEVNVRGSYSTSSALLGKLQKGDSVTRTGIGDNGWSKVTYNGKTAYINSSYLTTTKPADVVVGVIKSLVITGYDLSPEFNPDVKSYVVNVPAEVEQIDVIPTLSDSNSTYEITGNTGLALGENIVSIVITAKDGTKTTYEIKAIRGTQELNLSKLALKGINSKGEEIVLNLNPTFSPSTKEYTINLSQFIKSATVHAISNNENAQIEIIGADELKIGQNTIEIIVKLVSEEKEDIVNYTIVLDNPAEVVDTDSIKINKKLAIMIGATSLSTIIGIGLAISSYRKENDDELYMGEDYNFLDNDYNDYNIKQNENTIEVKEKNEKQQNRNIIEDIFGNKGFSEEKKKGGKHF